MSDAKHDPNSGYEASDANTRAVIVVGVGLAVLLVGSMAVCWWLLGLFESEESVATDHPMTDFRPTPEGPLLQASPNEEIDQHDRDIQQQLNTYGWVDEPNGIVHIPIERAMALTAERGLPARNTEGNR